MASASSSVPANRFINVDLAAHVLQLVLELGDALSNQSAVRFELLLPWAALADAAFLALELGVQRHQLGQQVRELGQFDLKLPLPRAGAPGENVQDQLSSVHDSTADAFGQVAGLNGVQFRVDYHDVGPGLAH